MADNASVSSQKRNRSPSESSPNVGKKKPKKRGTSMCPICLEKIVESTKTKTGQDAIFCEGACDAWLHRRCAGLSKPVFNTLDKSSDPFFCPHCQLKKYAREIDNLKAVINSLSDNLNALQSAIKLPEQPTQESMSINMISEPPSLDPTPRQLHQAKSVPQSSYSADDKKFNIVVYGIKECPPKTAKHARLEQDVQNIASAFEEAELPINTDSVRDHFRLGKYKTDAERPRPILIKFLRSTDASLALSKSSSFKSPVRIKPDLTPEERKIENYLLKERWSLIQLGFERPRIKLRNKSIFVDNKLYGQFHNFEFKRSQYNPPLNKASTSNQATDQSVAPANANTNQ